MKLDKIDLEIVRMLKENSRISLSEISEKVSLSRPTVKARIEALEKMGVIKKFTIILDKSALVENFYTFFLLKSTKRDILEKLREMDEVVEIYQLMGTKNIMLKVIVPKISSLQNLIERISLMDVSDIEIFPVLKTEKQEYESDIGPEIGVKIECDYCKNTITGDFFKFKVHNKIYYFCCPICERKFREKYRKREILKG